MTDRLCHFRKKSINYWVHALASSLAKGATRYYGTRFNIRLPEMRVLSNLDSYGLLAARDLVRLSAMDKGLVSRVLSTLSERGWVVTMPQDRGARLRKFRLTQAGHEMVERLRPVWRGRESQIQAELTVQERELLVELLKKLFVASEDLRQEEANLLAGKEPLSRAARDTDGAGETAVSKSRAAR